MKSILVIGAGITGGYIAHRLFKSGANVTLLSRGEKAQRLKKQGLKLRDGLTGKEEVCKIPITDNPKDKEYELVMVCVQEIHREEIEKIILDMKGNPIVWFLGNTIQGFNRAGELLGKERILGGFPDVGGTWENNTLVYADRRKAKHKPFNKLIIGNAFPESKIHTQYVINEFMKYKIGVEEFSPIMDWHLCHLVFVLPLAGIYYHFEGNINELLRSKSYLNKCIIALIQGIDLLRERGHKILPKELNKLRYIPKFLIRKKIVNTLNSKLGKIALLGHANCARDEMKIIAKGILDMTTENSGKDLIELLNEI